jgi:diguanylate cyclase (GGDEF)-like protein
MPSPLDLFRAAPAERLLKLSNLAVFLLTIAAYAALAQVSTLLYNPNIDGVTLWLGAGLGLGLLLILPTRQWHWVIAAIGISEFIRNLLHDTPIAGNLFLTSASCIEPLLGAALIRHSGNSAGALAPQRNMLGFLAYGVFAAPFVAASISAFGTLQIDGTPFASTWSKWFVTDALGVLVVAPVILARIKFFNPRQWPREQMIFTLLLVCTCPLVLRNWSDFLDVILPYVFLAYMLWAALRFDLQGTALTILLIALAASLSMSLGYVPYHADALPQVNGITMMQIRLIVLSSTALVVAVLTHDLIQGLRNEKRLMYQAHRDELTGLYNRAGLNFRVENSIQRRQSDKPLHLLICDIDAFKPINDKHGHLAGDEVLVEIASRLRACIRDGDAAARIGGDEFVVLLDSSDEKTVTFIAKRILEQMAKPVRGSFGVVQLSMSIGITPWETTAKIQSALRAADQALYKAKHEGKNRYVWASAAA